MDVCVNLLLLKADAKPEEEDDDDDILYGVYMLCVCVYFFCSI